MSHRIMIMAGGTGGHIFPAMAVARSLQRAGCKVTWLGSRGGMEETLVTRENIEGNWLSIRGVRGKGLLTKLMAPFRLLLSVIQAIRVMRKQRPDAVLGMGGFASGPGGIAAWLLRKPLIIHEQNAIAGTTNRILSRFAHQVFEAFPHSFTGKANATVSGNPVRSDIIALPLPEKRLSNREGPIRILVLGGSQGALKLNQYVPAELIALAQVIDLEIRHQAGEKTLAVAQQGYEHSKVNATVESFIDDMAEVYAWADIVICRAGALTVSELAAAGLGSVMVPFPFAIDDHQTANAQHLVNLGAAHILQESEFTAGALCDLLKQLISDRKRLSAMAIAAQQLARPEAANTVAGSCIRLAAGVAHD